jgi:hypothetical protein
MQPDERDVAGLSDMVTYASEIMQSASQSGHQGRGTG